MKTSFFKKSSSKQNFEKTLEEYTSAAKKSPGDVRIHIKIAELYWEHKNKDKAIKEYLHAAKEYENQKLLQLSMALYNYILSIDPSQTEVYTNLASLYLETGFRGDAAAIFEKLANYYYGKGLKSEAIEVINKITEIDPTNELFKLKVAQFYTNTGLGEKTALVKEESSPSESTEKKQATVHPGAEEPPDDFFDLEAALSDDLPADVSLQGAAINKPDAARETFAQQNPYDEIFREIKSSIESAPDQNSSGFHYNLGAAYQQLGQFEEAIEEFKKALDTHEKTAVCYLQLAKCARSISRLDKAEKYIKKGLAQGSLTAEDKATLHDELELINKAMGARGKFWVFFKTFFRR